MSAATHTFQPDSVSPYLRMPARIPGLAVVGLDEVPDDLEDWYEWREAVLAYREKVRRICEEDPEERKAELKLCADDPAYWIVMYGIIFEPRGLNGRPPRWLRWVLYAFQVQVIRAIEASMETDELGRGDFIGEKSRDMGMTWLLCAIIDHHFLFHEAFVAGIVSRNAEAVDKTFSSDSVFFKIKANLGLLPMVPRHMQLPKWMKPRKLTDDYVVNRTIQHPDRMCVIMGETSTELAGVGGRATVRFNDELSRFADGEQAWANQGPVSNHRWGIGSADLKNPHFKRLADRGRLTFGDPSLPGPTFMRLDWWLHPEHTPEWYARERDRYADQPQEFAREYDINYFAGAGDRVYPNFQNVQLVHAPYDPTLKPLWCAIDPGIADPTAIIWIAGDPMVGRFRVVEAFQGIGGETPEFIASLLTGVKVGGYGGFDYSKYPHAEEIMAWTATLRRAILYVGDPYGNNRGADGRRTFYQALREESHKLTGGSNVINVNYNTRAETGDGRTYLPRKKAVEHVWSRVDFNRAYGPNMVLTALVESRYPEKRGGSTAASEVLEPMHDEYSHIRSSFEYWAIDVQLREGLRERKPEKAQRVSMSGKAIR